MSNDNPLSELIEKRSMVLGSSLYLEKITSIFIASLLEVKDIRKSRTLSNTSSALSFNQKIDLLIDLGALNSKTKGKFIAFMEIRNQFMHNYDANTYVECFSYLPGKEAFILKTYPQPASLDKEEALEKAVNALCADVMNIAVTVIEAIDAKYTAKGRSASYEEVSKKLIGSLDKIKEAIDVIVLDHKNSRKNDKPAIQDGLSDLVIQRIREMWIVELKEIAGD